jgi:hypothetical protein
MDFEFDFILQTVGGSEHYLVASDEMSVDNFLAAFLQLFEGCDPVAETVQDLQCNNPGLTGMPCNQLLRYMEKNGLP